MPSLSKPVLHALKVTAAAVLVGFTALTVAPIAGSATPASPTVRGTALAARLTERLAVVCANPLVQTAPWSVITYLCAKPNDLVDVRIGDVHATQPSLGYDEVYYKLGRYTLGKDVINKKYDDWCEANGQVKAATVASNAKLNDPTSFTCVLPVGQETPESIAAMKTVVVGPLGSLYLTDGHHTLTAFNEMADGGPNTHVRLRVLGNLSLLSPTKFWTQMELNKWVWLRDPAGNAVSPSALPAGVGLANFADDKNRSLLYFARDIGYSASSVPFQEFYWGSWIRDARPVDLSGWNSNDAASYLDTVKKVSVAQTALPGTAVVDSGFTATDLGVLPLWNAGLPETGGEFAKLSKPYSDAKPGKIAYALAYKAGLPR